MLFVLSACSPFTLMEKRVFQEGHKNCDFVLEWLGRCLLSIRIWNGTRFWWWGGGRWYVLSMTHWFEETANINRKWDPGVEVRFGGIKNDSQEAVEVWGKELCWEDGLHSMVRGETGTCTEVCLRSPLQGLPTTMQASAPDAALPDPSHGHVFPSIP